MNQFSIFQVTKIELASTFIENGNSRSIRITSKTLDGNEQILDLTVYGDTEAADALPKSADFYATKLSKRVEGF